MSEYFLEVTKTITDNGYLLEAEIPKNVGICAKVVDIEVEKDGKVKNLSVIGGCAGNLKAVANLIEGKNIREVIDALKGIECGNKGTSCPNMIAKILEIYGN